MIRIESFFAGVIEVSLSEAFGFLDFLVLFVVLLFFSRFAAGIGFPGDSTVVSSSVERLGFTFFSTVFFTSVAGRYSSGIFTREDKGF